jgi:hypothetical protein
MATVAQGRLFRWHEVDAASDIERLRLCLSALPDEALMQRLERQRGKGRDDYPVRPTWNALVAGVVYQHPSAASLLRELWRNGELREACGFDVHAGASAVPSEDAFGRFLASVMACEHELESMFHKLVDELGRALPDLGQRMAVDSKAIASAGKPVSDEAKQAAPDGRRDLEADWGKKTYRGTRQDGSLWEKTTKWFGYKLHLLVDSRYELPLAFKLTVASRNDSPELLPLVEQLSEHHPQFAEQPRRELAADKGYDSAENNQALYDDHEIVPVIDTRQLWKEEPTRPLRPNQVDSFVHNERGELFCIDPLRGELRSLAFVGFEADRGTLKYRCPAAALGMQCPGRERCEEGRRIGPFGRVVRVPLDTDRRIFTASRAAHRKVEEGLPAPYLGRARQQPHRPSTRLRGPLHSRHGQDEGSRDDRARRHAGHGPGTHSSGPEGPDAFPARTSAHRVLNADTDPAPIVPWPPGPPAAHPAAFGAPTLLPSRPPPPRRTAASASATPAGSGFGTGGGTGAGPTDHEPSALPCSADGSVPSSRDRLSPRRARPPGRRRALRRVLGPRQGGNRSAARLAPTTRRRTARVLLVLAGRVVKDRRTYQPGGGRGRRLARSSSEAATKARWTSCSSWRHGVERRSAERWVIERNRVSRA